MIVYALTCAQDHGFESWFKDSAAYDTLRAAGAVTCPTCGSAEVEKAVMAPSVARTDLAPQDTPEARFRKAALAVRRHVETHYEHVGPRFAAEARAMHDGASPERLIYGEATPDEARGLVEDGVPVLPLPRVDAGDA